MSIWETAGHKFPNYNIREWVTWLRVLACSAWCHTPLTMNWKSRRYIKRRAREYFRKEVPENTVMERLNFAREQLEVVKRQSIVYGLYSRRDLKNVMVCIADAWTIPFSVIRALMFRVSVPSGIEGGLGFLINFYLLLLTLTWSCCYHSFYFMLSYKPIEKKSGHMSFVFQKQHWVYFVLHLIRLFQFRL